MKFNYAFEQFGEIAVNSDKLTKRATGNQSLIKALSGALTVQVGFERHPA